MQSAFRRVLHNIGRVVQAFEDIAGGRQRRAGRAAASLASCTWTPAMMEEMVGVVGTRP